KRQESVWFRVNGMTAFNIAVGIADILKKRTAEKNVDCLMPPAYSQQRLFCSRRVFGDLPVKFVKRVIDVKRLPVVLLVIVFGVDIVPAGEKKTIAQIQHFIRVRVIGADDNRV